MSCNPCNTGLTNTAACESLPSQIQNFADAFFGTIVKTEVNGEVIWNLPCNLGTGLPNNQRGEGEGLACYFLRLFMDGIVGLTGPQGEDGVAGADGRNAYTVTLQGFVQPSAAAPNIQVLTPYNPAIVEGLYVFIATSGWYQVTTATTEGVLFLTLHTALPGAPAFINAGKLVIPSGVPGASVQGQQGQQGIQGNPGSNATSFSVNEGVYFAPIGTDYQLGITYAAVDFVNSSPQVLLTNAGRYRVSVVADLVGLAGVLTSDKAFLKLHNTSSSTDVAGSEHQLSNFVDTARSQITIIARVETTGANQTIALFGKADTAARIAVVALNTTVVYDQLS